MIADLLARLVSGPLRAGVERFAVVDVETGAEAGRYSRRRHATRRASLSSGLRVHRLPRRT